MLCYNVFLDETREIFGHRCHLWYIALLESQVQELLIISLLITTEDQGVNLVLLWIVVNVLAEILDKYRTCVPLIVVLTVLVMSNDV